MFNCGEIGYIFLGAREGRVCGVHIRAIRCPLLKHPCMHHQIRGKEGRGGRGGEGGEGAHNHIITVSYQPTSYHIIT